MKKLIGLLLLLALPAWGIEYIAPGSGSGGVAVSNYVIANSLLNTPESNATTSWLYLSTTVSGGAGGGGLALIVSADGITDTYSNRFQIAGTNSSTNTLSAWIPPSGSFRFVGIGGAGGAITPGPTVYTYFPTNGSSGGGSGGISLTDATNAAQTVAGAVNIKLSPYNATGDGATDDSLAFYYARTNPVIYIPPGVYITTNVFFSNSTAIYGQPGASIIKFKPNIYGVGDQYNGNYLFHSRYGSIKLRDLILDGGTSTNWYLPQTGFTNRDPINAGSGLYRGGVFVGTDTNQTPIVDSCEFRNFDGAGVYVRGAENAQNAVSGRAIVINSSFSNNYTGVLTDNGGTADYTRIENNIFHRNYHAINLRGGNVTVVGNQATSNYITLWQYCSDARSHNTIVGNTFNHSGLAAFYFEGAGSGAGISDNALAGGADIYFLTGGGAGSSNQVFRANRFNSCNIYSAAGCASNSFLLNDFAVGAPSYSGSGSVWFWHNITPTNSIWPADPQTVYYPPESFSVVGTGTAKLTSSSPSPAPHYIGVGWNQSAANATFTFGLEIEPDVTSVTVSYYWVSGLSSGTAYWQDTWTTWYNANDQRAGGVNYTTNVFASNNLLTNVIIAIPMPSTNAWKQLNFSAAASTNANARFIPFGLTITKFR